ncbi:methyltransferase regulatory domain-containing protein [Verrucomicrobiota bacterium sgz303538]
MPPTANAYDDVSYESFAYPQSRPDRLATVATLFGMQPRAITGCRVLELGCASGGNLLPMAASLPGSHFVGVDLSARQIAEAQLGTESLRLRNVEFHAASLTDIGEELGAFDYIIAHGLYSWVAAPVREKLLALCARHLMPDGVAYISYNIYPGCSTRETLREMVRVHTRGGKTLSEKITQARALFARFETAFRGRSDAFALLVQEELTQLKELGDFYIAHEYLENVNDACYFHEFAAHAAAYGLQYLGESEIQTMGIADLAPEAGQAVRELASDLIQAEQYLDFLRNRTFRQSLLCHSTVPLDRRIPFTRIQNLYIASSAKPTTASADIRSSQQIEFRGPDGVTIRANDPFMKAAFSELSEAWPLPLHFPDLIQRASARAGVTADTSRISSLGSQLVACHASSRSIEFRVAPLVFQTQVSEYPRALEIARWQAGRGSRVTNARHENIILGQAERTFLALLDGTRNIDSLTAEFPNAQVLLTQFAGSAVLES